MRSLLGRLVGRARDGDADRALPRRAHFIAGLLYPFWYLLTPEGARDAWWTWGGVGLAHLLVALLALWSPKVNRLLFHLFPVPWLVTLQVYTLAWLNDMRLFYAVASVAAVLAFCASSTSRLGLASYGAFVAALGLLLFALDPDPVKAACWGGVIPVVVIAHQRLGILRVRERLAEEYRDRLEQQVSERTRELSEANRRLRTEMEERKRLEEGLRVANKLEAVGRLAGGVAHEFNNLLTRIRLYSELALKSSSEESDAREDIDEIRKASRQAGELTKQLLAFSRQGDAPREVLDLDRLVSASSVMLQHLLGEERSLEVLLSGEALGILANRSELEQVLVNLTLNARDATRDGGRVTIETSVQRHDGPSDDGLPERFRGGELVRLVFADTGAGMDAETQARAFDPFFTRRPDGTGLGLSVVHGIVNRTGGHVRVRSEPGKGARFEFYWPRARNLGQEDPPRVRPSDARVGSETILLVEDERDLGLALERILRSGGYDVTNTRNADEALRIARQTDAPIHVLVSDVVMPGMNGVELAEKLCAMHPETKIILISGHLGPRDGAQLHVPPAFGFLAKPFEADDLMTKIRELLDAPPTR